MLTSRLWICDTGVVVPQDIEFELRNLEHQLKLISKSDVHKGKTRAVKAQLEKYAPATLRDKSTTVNPELIGKMPANLRLDRILTNFDGSQNMNIELCFNNRETAGTNLLKLSTASAFQSNSSASYSLGVLLVPTRDLLELGGWDPAYGDSAEYSYYFKTAYSKALHANLLVIELSSVF